MATAETQKIVDQLNAGTTTIADLVKLYPSFSADEIQKNWDTVNAENNYTAPVYNQGTLGIFEGQGNEGPSYVGSLIRDIYGGFGAGAFGNAYGGSGNNSQGVNDGFYSPDGTPDDRPFLDKNVYLGDIEDESLVVDTKIGLLGDAFDAIANSNLTAEQMTSQVAELLRATTMSTDALGQVSEFTKEQLDNQLALQGYDTRGNSIVETDEVNLTDTGLDNDLLKSEDLGDLGDLGSLSDVQIGPSTESNPNDIWDNTVDTENDSLSDMIQAALDIFGPFSKQSIGKLVGAINNRNISVGELATETGNTVEGINEAATASGVSINNQEGIATNTGTGAKDTGTKDTGTKDTGTKDASTKDTDTKDTGTKDTGTKDTGGKVGGNDVVADDVVVDDRVIVTDYPETPAQTKEPKMSQPLMTAIITNTIQKTPVTDSVMFEPKKFEIDNITPGMFERFMRAAGGR